MYYVESITNITFHMTVQWQKEIQTFNTQAKSSLYYSYHDLLISYSCPYHHCLIIDHDNITFISLTDLEQKINPRHICISNIKTFLK